MFARFWLVIHVWQGQGEGDFGFEAMSAVRLYRTMKDSSLNGADVLESCGA